LHGSLSEGSISAINEDPEDHFKSKMKQIIQRSVIFNNQTETITVSQTRKFATRNQPYLRRLCEI